MGRFPDAGPLTITGVPTGQGHNPRLPCLIMTTLDIS